MKKFIFLIFSLILFSCKKKTSINTTSIDNSASGFQGYRVDPTALAGSKQKDFGKSYWGDIPYPADLFLSVFQKSTLPSQEVQTNASSWGDFNNDGYMDIFNAGGSYDGYIRASASFIIWNKQKKTFEETNLFNDKTIKIIGGNVHTVIPKYFNSDDYVDLLLIDNGDEGRINPGRDEPVRIVLSDGLGGYDVKEISTTEYDNFFSIMNQRKLGGDIGDLNGDGFDDLFLACNSINFIFWGVPQFPYFKKEGRVFFASDFYNPIFNNQTGMSSCSECADHIFSAKIFDLNKDGKKDVIAFGADKANAYYQRIFFNRNNNGVFVNQDVLKLPLNHASEVREIQDLIIDDVNDDGKFDILYLQNYMTGDRYTMNTYIQKDNLTFEIDNTWFDFTTKWGYSKLKYFDINNDGKKDVTMLSSYGNKTELLTNNMVYNKKALIRIGNKFETKDYYLFDDFSKLIRDANYK